MKNYSSNVIWGSIFIILGLGIAGNILNIWHFSIFFPGWWTLFIIIPCGKQVLQKGLNPLPTAGLVIGFLLLLSQWHILPGNFIWKMFIPIVLLTIGFNLIFRETLSKKKFMDFTKNSSESYKSGMPEYSAILSSQKITCDHETFYGATINAIFGGASMDLRNAYFQEDVLLNCTAIFGGADIYIPNDINVQVSCVPIFGGVSNPNHPFIPGAPTLYINATCMFGGIDIK